jgi:hypothetical protein
MAMTLSPGTVQVTYEYLCQLPPFKRLKMPASQDVTFEVNGEYEPEHVIRISRAKVGFLETLIKTVAHEMVHLHLYRIGYKGWNLHDKKFEYYANRISTTMGFDPKEF